MKVNELIEDISRRSLVAGIAGLSLAAGAKALTTEKQIKMKQVILALSKSIISQLDAADKKIAEVKRLKKQDELDELPLTKIKAQYDETLKPFVMAAMSKSPRDVADFINNDVECHTAISTVLKRMKDTADAQSKLFE